MNTATETQSDKDVRLFRLAVDRAERRVGNSVFGFLQGILQEALIAEEILTIITSQDEDVSDARVRDLGSRLRDLLNEWANV